MKAMQLKVLQIAFLLAISLCLSVRIRVVTLPMLNGDLLLGIDSARHTRLAKIISEKGILPENDVMRSVPLGRETKNQLTLFPYLIGYLHQAIKPIFPNITVQQVAIVLPVILGTLAMMVLFALVRKLFDVYTALLAVNIAAITPPLAGRTLAGFADKDGLALLLGLIAFYFYINSLRESRSSRRLTFALSFGFSMTLLGLTWEGVGVFLGATIITELIMLLFDQHDLRGFIVALCRYLPVLVGLPLSKAVYRELSHPFVILAIGLPFFLLLLSLLCLMANHSRFVLRVLSLNDRIPVALSLSAMMLAFVTVLSWDTVFIFSDRFLSSFGSSQLAQSIVELRKQGALGWAFWPGAFFLVSCTGALFVYKDIVSCFKINIPVSLMLLEIFLMGVPFSRILLVNPSHETRLTLSIYLGTLTLFLIGTLVLYLIAIRRGEYKTDFTTYERLFLIIWFALMLLLSRSAIRLEFLFAMPAAILGAYVVMKLLLFLTDKFKVLFFILLSVELWELYAVYSASTKSANFSQFNIILLLSLLICTMIILFGIFKAMRAASSSQTVLRFCGIIGLMLYMIFTTSSAPTDWIGGYAEKSYRWNTNQRPFVTPELQKALRWMSKNLPSEATVAAWWEYGSWINLLGKKGTIIDEAQLDYWVHLMARHVFLATDEYEALEFLYTHQAKYLMITRRNITSLPIISALGSDENFDRHAKILHFGAVNETIKTDSGKIIYRYLIGQCG